MTEPPLPSPPDVPPPTVDVWTGPGPVTVRWAITGLRVCMILGIASLLLGSAVLLLYGTVLTARQIVLMVTARVDATANRGIFLASIKLVDLVLLATIMQVVGIGIYALFVNKNIPVPLWLRTADVDQLKLKLGGIVAVMLGVLFLEQVFYWGSDRNLLPLGIAVAIVIAALAYFIRAHSESN